MSHLLLPLISHGFSLALLEHENYSMSSFLGHSFCFPCPPPLNLDQCHCGFAGLGKLCQFFSQLKCLELKQGSPRHCLISECWCGLSVLWAGLTPSGWAQWFPPDFLCSSGGSSGERPKDFSACVYVTQRGRQGCHRVSCASSPKKWSLLCHAHLNLGGKKKSGWFFFFFHPLPPIPAL